MICSIGAEPMWCALGHHDVMSLVKSSKARAWSTSTTTSRRIASTVSIMVLASFIPCSLLEGGQRTLPKPVEMPAQQRDALRVDLVQPPRSLMGVEDQADILEHLQVLGHGRSAHRQHLGELPDGKGTVRQPVEDGLAGRVPQGG